MTKRPGANSDIGFISNYKREKKDPVGSFGGQGIANPVGMILSVGMMFEFTFGRPDLNHAIEAAIAAVLADGIKTREIGGTASSSQMTDAILERLAP